MFGIDWTEFLIIGAVALVVIGPKDLPKVLRTVGQWVGRARALARDFQNGLDDMVRETELDDIRKKMNEAGMAADPRGILDEATQALNAPLNEPDVPVSTLPPAGGDVIPPGPADDLVADAAPIEPLPAEPVPVEPPPAAGAKP